MSVNERILATSEAYETRNGAQKAAERFMEIASKATITIQERKNCTWCGLKVTGGMIHQRCQEAKQRIQKNPDRNTGVMYTRSRS